VNDNFKELSKVLSGKDGWQTTLGYYEKSDWLIGCVDEFTIKIWKFIDRKTLYYHNQYKLAIADIHQFIPAVVDKEDCVIIAGRSFQIVIFGLENYRQDFVLKKMMQAQKNRVNKKVYKALEERDQEIPKKTASTEKETHDLQELFSDFSFNSFCLLCYLLSCCVAFFNRECLGETRQVSIGFPPRKRGLRTLLVRSHQQEDSFPDDTITKPFSGPKSGKIKN